MILGKWKDILTLTIAHDIRRERKSEEEFYIQKKVEVSSY